MREAPSRARQYVRGGDVLTSTVRPNRHLSAIVAPEQGGCVASSGFVIWPLVDPEVDPPRGTLVILNEKAKTFTPLDGRPEAQPL